jgi:DNA-binding CsgD family transcriptional regulator
MDRITDAARLACRIATVAEPAEVWRSVKTFAADSGFDHLTVLKAHPELPHRLAPSVVYIDAPHGFADEFDRQGLCPQHPLIVRALERLAPFSASDMRAEQLTDSQRRVMLEVSASLGVRDGWTFPIADRGTLRGIVMLGGAAPDMSPLLCSILHVLAHGAFKRHEELELGRGQKPHRLSPRELECLRWVALGKTDAEIALILSISARTARFHVENAKQKLQVATRVQAVAVALRLHAIAA